MRRQRNPVSGKNYGYAFSEEAREFLSSAWRPVVSGYVHQMQMLKRRCPLRLGQVS